jgi:GAF domain-containing protein
MPLKETKSSVQLLYNVSRELASALDLRTVLTRVVLQSLKYVGGERGSLVVFDEQGKPMDAAIVIGMQVHDQKTQQLRETTERGLAGLSATAPRSGSRILPRMNAGCVVRMMLPIKADPNPPCVCPCWHVNSWWVF